MGNSIQKGRKSGRELFGGLLAIIILVALDQFTKALAVAQLKGKEDIRIIPNVLHLHYLENQSAAFSMDPVSLLHRIFHFDLFIEHPDIFLNAKMIFFAVITVAVIVIMILLYLRIPHERHYLFLDIVLIGFVAGAIGNLIDRLLQQYVVDFIYFILIDFPVFNVADIYVTCAAALFILVSLFYYKDEDFAVLFPGRKEDK